MRLGAPDPSRGPLLGLDEAGRGSWVGPLVVGGFLADPATVRRLPGLGVRDSKLLSPAQRVIVLGRLRAAGRCVTAVLPPRVIDRSVSTHALNRLEARAFADLVRRTRPGRVFADACDPNPTRFASQIQRLSGTRAPVVALHHADRDLPVVAAASIVAKVSRDRAIARLAARLGEGLGSGYPSDRRTVEFVTRYLGGASAPPQWLRASWAPTERVKLARPASTLEGFA